MKKDISASKMASCLLGIGLLFTGYGCTDSDFDLSHIDQTIGIGGDSLALPVSGTEDIKLDDVLELDNSDLITTESNGDYVFKKEGASVEPAYPHINEVVIAKQQMTSHDLVVNVNTSAAKGNRARVAAMQTVEGTVVTYSYKSDTQKSIKNILSASADGTLNISVQFSDELKRVVNSFRSMTLQLPEYMTFSTPVTTPAYSSFDGHTLTFSNVNPAHGISINARLNKLAFGVKGSAGNTLAYDTHLQQATMEGNVKVKVTFNDINAVSVDPAKCTIKTQMTMGNITIKGAQGMFDPDIDLGNLGEVTINSIPDFLSGDDVRINLYNPMINLDVDNNMNIEGKVKGTITAYDEKGKAMAQVEVPAFTINASATDGQNTTTRICICKNKPEEADGRTAVLVPTLSDLMTRIPKTLKFVADVKANSEKTADITLGSATHYRVAPSYSIKADLAFDRGAQIVYRDTLDGWNDDMDDYALAEGSFVKITANVSNSIPANLSVSAHAIGTDRKAVSDDRILVQVTGRVKGAADGKAVNSPLEIRIYEKQKGALKTIDGLALKVEAAAGEGTDAIVGKTINAKTQTLKVSNMVIKLYGRVISDLN